MRVLATLLLALVACSSLAAAQAAPPTIPADLAEFAIPNKWIVQLKPKADRGKFKEHSRGKAEAKNASKRKRAPAGSASDVVNRVKHDFGIGKDNQFQGITGTFDDDVIAELAQHPDVQSVVPDTIIWAEGSQANPPSWGLGRVSQRAPSASAPFTYPDNAGQGVTVYVVDSGILTTHPEFEARASSGWAPEGWPTVDDCGHGTHVAGTVASATYGVAKKASVVSVKVLNGSCGGQASDFIAGINWIARQATSSKQTVIANMSVGGPFTTTINSAIAAAYSQNVAFAVAAGNSRLDACRSSPAGEPTAVTVGATNKVDSFDTTYSNRGACVDILAPGTDILSTSNNGATTLMTGTSMASPHVAGAMALQLASNPAQTSAQVVAAVLGRATANVVTNVPRATANKLLFVPSA